MHGQKTVAWYKLLLWQKYDVVYGISIVLTLAYSKDQGHILTAIQYLENCERKNGLLPSNRKSNMSFHPTTKDHSRLQLCWHLSWQTFCHGRPSFVIAELCHCRPLLVDLCLNGPLPRQTKICHGRALSWWTFVTENLCHGEPLLWWTWTP